MIICPTCKEEIDNDSHFCDQCGQALLFCDRCGSVGVGRRCTKCGGLMVAPGGQQSNVQGGQSRLSESLKMDVGTTGGVSMVDMVQPNRESSGVPVLTLANDSLNIRIVGINGAVIGRKNGPYTQFFAQYPYVSGTHAQLKYNASTGWCITDKHSSNGTKLNQRPLQPDVEMSLNNGDVLTLANINLQVIVR
ncbi:MAG: FHA domain-containing protein [Prevotella sp.]|nr:FHA domain-containing protein [Prevotella sp.]